MIAKIKIKGIHKFYKVNTIPNKDGTFTYRCEDCKLIGFNKGNDKYLTVNCSEKIIKGCDGKKAINQGKKNGEKNTSDMSVGKVLPMSFQIKLMEKIVTTLELNSKIEKNKVFAKYSEMGGWFVCCCDYFSLKKPKFKAWDKILKEKHKKVIKWDTIVTHIYTKSFWDERGTLIVKPKNN